MATADSVKNKIQNLITKANTKTGRSDSDMTSAVNALVSGYNPNGITPSGTINIASNGMHNVANYASAQVSVPVGITPSGSIDIKQNGTVDVTNYASAVVDVPTSNNVTIEAYDITIASTLGNGANSNSTILTGNAFVKSNRSKDTFAILLYPKAPISTTASRMSHSVYHGNVNLATTDIPRYGFSYCGSSASAIGFAPITNKLDTNGYNVSFRTTTAGNLSIYVASNRQLPAGDYALVLMNWEGLL